MAEPRADAVFKAKVESRLAASLAERGYKQLAKRDLIFHLDIQSADGIRGWLGLPMAIVRMAYVDTTPAVGVHDPKVEHVLADLRAERYDQNAATLTEPLAYLVPDRRGYPMWTFSDLPGLDQALDKLVDAIDTRGRRFVESLDERRVLASALRGDLRNRMVFRLPATLLVLGHRRRAIWLARYFKVRYGRGSEPLQPSTQRFCGA